MNDVELTADALYHVQELSQLHMEIFKLKKQIRRLQLENKAGPSSAQSNPVKPLSSKN